MEAAIQAEQARLREEEEERIALELAKLEAEPQKQEDAERREAEPGSARQRLLRRRNKWRKMPPKHCSRRKKPRR